MNDLSFRLPDNFPSARSLLLIATSAPLMIINLRFADRHIPFSCHRTTLPRPHPRHAPGGDPPDHHPDSGHRVDRVDYHFFMKLAAVRSGLAQYGRNNICYVEGMGSFFHSTPT